MCLPVTPDDCHFQLTRKPRNDRACPNGNRSARDRLDLAGLNRPAAAAVAAVVVVETTYGLCHTST